MADPGSVFYIAESDEGDALGIVRFQVEGDKAVASINIAPEQRSKGYGGPFLRIASKRLFQDSPVARVDAYIKPDNEASVKVFSHAGYRLHSRTNYQGHPADLYVLKEEDL
jgi:RimJ/RimL family protein N-acetyltransferase